MQITVEIPDEIAATMLRPDRDRARELMELSVLSALRDGRIHESEAAALLGMDSRFELWDWLRAVDPDGSYDTAESIQEQLEMLANHKVSRALPQTA